MKPITIKHERREYEIEYLLSIVSTPCPQLNRNKWKLDLETYTFIFNTKKEQWRLLEITWFEIELSFANWLGNFDE